MRRASHGVASRPATLIRVSTTTASANIAMMPATIWSLLFSLESRGEPGAQTADADHRSHCDHRDVGRHHHPQSRDQHRNRQWQFDLEHPGDRARSRSRSRRRTLAWVPRPELEHRAHHQCGGVRRQRDDDMASSRIRVPMISRQDHEQCQRRDGEHQAGGRRRQPAKHPRPLHQQPERQRDRQSDHHRHQSQPQMNQGQRPGGRPDASSDSARKLLGRLALLPRPTRRWPDPADDLVRAVDGDADLDGDDRAASNAWLRLPRRGTPNRSRSWFPKAVRRLGAAQSSASIQRGAHRRRRQDCQPSGIGHQPVVGDLLDFVQR